MRLFQLFLLLVCKPGGLGIQKSLIIFILSVLHRTIPGVSEKTPLWYFFFQILPFPLGS